MCCNAPIAVGKSHTLLSHSARPADRRYTIREVLMQRLRCNSYAQSLVSRHTHLRKKAFCALLISWRQLAFAISARALASRSSGVSYCST